MDKSITGEFEMKKALSKIADKEVRKAMEGEFKPESIERLMRLLNLTPTKEERKRWEEVGLMNNGKLCMSGDEIEDFSIVVLAIWDCMFEGYIERV